MFRLGDSVMIVNTTQLDCEIQDVYLGDMGKITCIDEKLDMIGVNIYGNCVMLFSNQLCKVENIFEKFQINSDK